VAIVDVFDERHARKVLTSFGRALEKLENSDPLRKQQETFVDAVVQGIAENGRVICVRLALFVEMVRYRQWTKDTLKAIGGVEGLCANFWEETLTAKSDRPQRRKHEKAARAVLKILLPESGQTIRGATKARQAILEASGYARSVTDFDELLHMLDDELHLIMPTVPPGAKPGETKVASSATPTGPLHQSGEDKPATPAAVPTILEEPKGRDDHLALSPDVQRYYQLTHDYLVSSLRDWLTLKQKETRRGRAELCLEERSALWTAKPENRQLPTVWEVVTIRLLTRRKDWTVPQKRMMRTAGTFYQIWGLLMLVSLILIGWGISELNGRLRARALVQNVITAETGDVPGIIAELAGVHHWADPLLRQIVGESAGDAKAQLHASMALLPRDSRQVEYLCERLLKAGPNQVAVIVAALADHKLELTERLWTVLEDANCDGGERLRAASALATYTPGDFRWKNVCPDVARKLVTENPFVLAKWTDALRPVSEFFAAPLADIIQDGKSGEAMKIAACEVVAAYAADDPAQFQELEKRLAIPVPGNAGDEDEIVLAKQKADIATAFLRMNQYEKMRGVMKHTPDPTARSFLIQRVSSLAVDPNIIWKELEQEKDVSIRRALILSLGGYALECLSLVEREAVTSQLVQWYRDDPDPGIHGATEWLLRQWKQDAEIASVIKELATGKVEGNCHWYVTRQGHTMVVIPELVEFLRETPPKRVVIVRGFAIADKPVTVEQYLRFRKNAVYEKQFSPQGDCPMNGVTWYEAAAYCNWLSEGEGLREDQWSYEPNSAKSFADGMKIRLGRRGYRLPSEWEWEYACRAGSVTHFCFGQPPELLRRYGWVLSWDDRTGPVGTLRPNDLGLFDVHGNVWQWCQDKYGNTFPPEGGGTVKENEFRVLRGGAFNAYPSNFYSSFRGNSPAGTRLYVNGFRPARNYN
jgi:formylglycine-generating enzyme required for sulfatase activity